MKNRGALEKALGLGTGYPVLDVLDYLADAAEHLIFHHDCAHEGFDELGDAIASARKIRTALAEFLTVPVKATPKYVIRFTDGSYNRDQGFEADLSEATRYDTREEAGVVAATLDTNEIVEVEE
jgi:hypothetical protein